MPSCKNLIFAGVKYLGMQMEKLNRGGGGIEDKEKTHFVVIALVENKIHARAYFGGRQTYMKA